MKQIKILIESFSSPNIEAEILAEISAALPGVEHAAEVIRDSNGKVVQVNVNLPDSALAAGLTTAANKINDNPGVSKASPFPVEGVDNFDGLTPGTNLTGSFVQVGTDVKIAPLSPGANSDWEAAPSLDSVGGTGSALAMIDKTFTGNLVGGNFRHGSRGILRLAAADLGLLSLKRLRVKFKVAYPNAYNTVTKDIGDVSDLLTLGSIRAGSGAARMRLRYDPVLFGNNNWFINTQNSPTFQDTGIDRQSFVQCEVVVDAAGTLTAKAGAITITDLGLLVGSVSNFIFLDMSSTDIFVSSANKTQRSVIIDDLELDVLEGE